MTHSQRRLSELAATRPHYAELLAARREGREFDRARAWPTTGREVVPVDRHALYGAFGRRERWTLPAGTGIICAADAHAFPGLRLMLASLLLSHDAPVTVFDLGMGPGQLAWLKRQPVSIVTPDLPIGPRFHGGDNRWTLWAKPHLFDQSPYEISIWLDSDLIVRRDLAPLAEMAERDGLAYFPDGFARSEVLLNKPEVYALHPVPEVFPTVNSGVVAFRRGHPTIERAVELLREVIDGEIAGDRYACWDQGLFKLAWEEAGIRPIGDPSWNQPGWTLAEIGSRLSPDELLARSRPGEITHYQSEPKPWAKWADWSPSLRPAPGLSVLILGHEPFTRPEREWITPIDLNDLDADPAWGENRIFHAETLGRITTEYVGLATFSWTRKYDAAGILAPWEAGELELSPNRVWCAQRTDNYRGLSYPDWRDHEEHFNPGIGGLIDELRGISGLKEIGPSCWSNNFIAHRDVIAGLVAFHRRMRAYFLARYPGGCPYKPADPNRAWAYLGEAFSVHWLASQPGLEFVEMRGGQVPSTARRLTPDQEWYVALPDAVKAAARDCPKQRPLAKTSCCGPDRWCEGGPHDGQPVSVLQCAKCRAEFAGVS